MARYYFNPNDYAEGDSWNELPFTARWNTSYDAFEIVTLGDGSKVLEATVPGSGNRLAAFDPVNDDPNSDEVEMVVLGRHISSSGATTRLSLTGRARADFHGYASGLRQDTNYRTNIIDGSGSGNVNALASWNGPDNRENWVWVRVLISGNQIRARVWLAGDDEPDNWNSTATDNTLSDPGFVGFYTRSGSYHVECFGVGTGGDPAPMEPMEEPAGDTVMIRLDGVWVERPRYTKVNGVWR